MAIKLVGLDFEASGTNPWGKHVPIEIGLALEADSYASWRIGGWDWNEWEWQKEAEQVHGIEKDKLPKTPIWQVDIEAAAWLLEHDWRNRMFTIPVGWNVAGYDRQFITRWMPNLNRLLSYRTIDLNTLVFAKALQSDHSPEAAYRGIKQAAKEHAAFALDYLGEAQWHAAGYDAAASLGALEYLTQ